MNLDQYKLWTAIITPMNTDLSIDFDSFEKLLNEQNQNDIGVVLLGSTGEGLALNLEEKKSVIKFARSLKLDIPLMSGVGGFDLPSIIEWMDFCHEQEMNAFLMATPLYAKPGPIGQLHWFKTLLDHSKLPCMLYNVPSRAGKELDLYACEELKNHSQFWALKEASGSIERFKEYREILKKQKIYSGDDGLTIEFANYGCDGLVSVASNIWAKQTKQYLSKCLNKDLSNDDKSLWLKAVDHIFEASNPIPTKNILFQEARIKTPCLKPPLSPEEKLDQKSLKDISHKITNWF